jgi:hypothetical protein
MEKPSLEGPGDRGEGWTQVNVTLSRDCLQRRDDLPGV